MERNPKVTIALPLYNGGELSRRAIECVLAQSYADLELLISDNCSTDGVTPELCHEYARKDPRVRYTRTEQNLGAAGNYCRTVELARGEYFRWISHDDLISPEFVRECIEVAESDPEIITVAPIMEVRDQHGNPLQSISSYVGRKQWSTDRLEQYDQMLDELAYCETHDDGLFMIAYEYGFHRRSRLLRTRLVMPFISSDFVLAAELALWGRLVFLDAPLSVFTISVNAGGTSLNFSSWNPEAIQRMLSPSKVSPFDVQISVRRRHFEHVAAVLRSPLSPAQKARAALLATRPMRARVTDRVRKRFARAAAGSAP